MTHRGSGYKINIMIRILPSKLNGVLHAPASQAHAQRLLFASAMPSVPTVVKNVPECDDINTTIDCLEAFGCRVVMNDARNEAVVDPFAKNVPAPSAVFDFRKSATTSRIAIALAGALGYKAECRAEAGLSKRQLVPLTSRMSLRGVKVTSFSLPLSLSGRLAPGEYLFNGGHDASFISAMLMALPLLSGDSSIVVDAKLVDPYPVNLTLDVLEKFGIEVSRSERGFSVKGRQQYSSPGMVSAENDWALSSLWIAAAAVCGGAVTVNGLPVSSPQKYRNIKPSLSLLAQDFRSVSLDASSCPELGMFFSALAAVKGADFFIDGISQLHFMESDRLKTMAECVRTLGGTAEYTESSIMVKGSEFPGSDDLLLDCKDDPWIFMSFALASAVLGRPLKLSGEDCAEKIYKNFLSDYVLLGGRLEKISV